MKNKPKPRMMWANYYPDTGNLSFHAENRQAKRWAKDGEKPFRVAVVPLDDVEAIVERARKAAMATNSHLFVDLIRAALTAAGIPVTKRKARK